MGWHAVGRTLVLHSRLRIRREGVVRGPAGRGWLNEAVVEWDLRVVVGDCHPGKLVATEGTAGQSRAQAGQCPPDLKLHPGHSSSISCWPVLGVRPGGPAAVGTAGDAQEEQQQGHQNASDEGSILTVRPQLAVPRDRVAGSLGAFTGNRAVVSMEARWARSVAAGPPEAGVADTFPSHRITGPLNTGGAGGATALPKGATQAGVFTAEPHPARITALTVPSVWLTGLPKPAVGALLSAAVAKGSRWAGLVALSPIPAWLTGLTAACVCRAQLILFAVATAVAALRPVVARLAGQLAARAAEAGRARALAGDGAAAAAHALARLPALGPPPPGPANAAAGILRARRAVAGAGEAAAAAPPARVTQAGAGGLITARHREVALAGAAARSRPPARVAAARARLRVATPMGAAGARELAAAAPAVGLAVAHAGVRLTLAIWVTGAALTTIRAPVLARAAGVALGPKESRFASTEAWFHAYFSFPAGIWSLADGDGTFLIFLPPAWAALELSRGAVGHADVPPIRVQLRPLGLLNPDQQQWEQQPQPHGGQRSRGLELVWPPQLPTPSLFPPKAFPEETRPEGRAAMRHLPERAGRRWLGRPQTPEK